MNNNKYLETAIKSAKIAGEKVLSLYKKIDKISQKNKNLRDIVSEVDNICDRKIKNLILSKFQIIVFCPKRVVYTTKIQIICG